MPDPALAAPTRRVPKHLCHVFPSFQIGGSQRRFAALVNHFGGAYRHTVIALDGLYGAATLVQDNIALEQMRPPAKRPFPWSVQAALTVLRRSGPDMLITYNWGAIDWAAANRIARVPHVHIEDGFGPEEASRQYLRRVLFRRLVLGGQATVVVPSRMLFRIATAVWKLDPATIAYIPNGIHCARFEQSPDAAVVAGFRGAGPVIGTVATLRREKALDRLIDAFAQIRTAQTNGCWPARLVIVGDGTERPRLEEQVVRLGLSDHVTFTGAMDHPERALTGFDIFAMSSDTEQMPLGALEAMAAGLPIVSTDAGDIQAMVADANRQFIVPKDSRALAAAISALLADSRARRAIGGANRQKVGEVYGEEKMFAAYAALFGTPA